jgi:alpha-1,2-mannosyltransferase
MTSMGDLGIYRAAARSVDRGHGLYGLRFPPLHMPFTYTPFAALVFVPLSWFGWDDVRLGVAIANILAVFGCAALSLRLASASRTTSVAACLVLGAVALWTEPVQQTLRFGQINLLLLLVVLVDLGLRDQNRAKGVLIGLAAAVKLTPAVLIAYLLVTRRWAAAARATAVVSGTILLGVVVLPAASKRYWTHEVFAAGRIGNPIYLANQSIKGVLVRLLGLGPLASALWLGFVAVAMVGGLLWARVLHQQGSELAGATVAAVAGLLASPISWSHHWVWVIPVLALSWEAARRSSSIALRTLPALAFVTFAAWWVTRPGVPGGSPEGLIWLVPGKHSVERTWGLGQTLIGDLYVELAILVAVTAAGAALLQHRRRRPAGDRLA